MNTQIGKFVIYIKKLTIEKVMAIDVGSKQNEYDFNLLRFT